MKVFKSQVQQRARDKREGERTETRADEKVTGSIFIIRPCQRQIDDDFSLSPEKAISPSCPPSPRSLSLSLPFFLSSFPPFFPFLISFIEKRRGDRGETGGAKPRRDILIISRLPSSTGCIEGRSKAPGPSPRQKITSSRVSASPIWR